MQIKFIAEPNRNYYVTLQHVRVNESQGGSLLISLSNRISDIVLLETRSVIRTAIYNRVSLLGQPRFALYFVKFCPLFAAFYFKICPLFALYRHAFESEDLTKKSIVY